MARGLEYREGAGLHSLNSEEPLRFFEKLQFEVLCKEKKKKWIVKLGFYST